MADLTHDVSTAYRLSDSDRRLPFNEPFTSVEAREFGVTRSELASFVKTGVLRRVFQGVYVDSAVPDTQLSRTQALSKILSPDAVVTDESAGWVHMVDLDPPGATVVAPPIRAFHVRRGGRVRAQGTAGGERSLTSADIWSVNGIRVTSPMRTALDLGRLRPRDQAIASLDALARMGAFTRDELLDQVGRFRGMRGVVQLRELAPLMDPRAASPPESIIRLRCLDFGLEPLEPQVEVHNRLTGEVAFLDLANRHLRHAVEFDGLAWHESAEAQRHDLRRRKWIGDQERWHFAILTNPDVYGVPREHTAHVVRRRLSESIANSRVTRR